MRARLIRVLLLLACVAIIVPLSGARPMMAQEGGEEEGMIQCTGSGPNAVIELKFPAAGGAVQGAYILDYTAHDTTPLWKDGTLDYYDEDRKVEIFSQFSGTYSGGEQGSFSGLRVTGGGTVEMKNLEDEIFNRSYDVQMDSPATAVWGAAGNIIIKDITGEFTLVRVNANEIPNTEWEDPESGVFPHELNLLCESQAQAPTPQDISCVVTTDPPVVGGRDNPFQASIQATGFDPGLPLDYAAWLWSSGTAFDVTQLQEGQNVAFSTDYEPTWPAGYYSITGQAQDGGFRACCSTHFTIGDVEPNSPPKCLDLQLVPSPPQPGQTTLGVVVTAEDPDDDPLAFSGVAYWGGWQGVAASGGGIGQESPNLAIPIPGGLPPGPLVVEVYVGDHDGSFSRSSPEPFHEQVRFQDWCSINLMVGPLPGAGGERGRCEPVGIIYLDDEGVEPNVLAIDAFIENALAQGGPEYSLIVSHRQRLIDKFGQEGFDQIDGLLHNMGNIAETCPFVLIVGNPDVVPFTVLPNPTDDGDVLFTDDIYGDNDHDGITMLDIPVARIPDGDSLDLLLTQLSPSNVPEGGDFTLANSKRPHADGVASQVFGPGRFLLESLPTRHGEVDAGRVNVRYSYFMLHGAWWDASIWWGEEDAYPQAYTVAEADSRGVVLSGSCYGAYVFNLTPENSIALAFLGRGARAFVGSTGIHYSPNWAPGTPPTGPMRYGALFQYAFLEALSQGEAPLAAFMKAKEAMAGLVWSGDATASEYKIMHEFVYYGKP